MSDPGDRAALGTGLPHVAANHFERLRVVWDRPQPLRRELVLGVYDEQRLHWLPP